MKLAIIIPLKAKSISKNWEKVEECLFNTLESIKNQTNNHYIALVVGHDCPSFLGDGNYHENIKFLKYTLQAPPTITDSYENNQINFENDRVRKIFFGFKSLEESTLTHVFPLDADDVISKHLVEEVSKLPKNGNLLIKKGYILYKNDRLLNKTENFNLFCGSSFIISIKTIYETSKSEALDDFIFKKVGHVSMENYLINNKISYQTSDKRLAIYIRENGENISRIKSGKFFYYLIRSIKARLRRKKITHEISTEFSIIP